MPQFNPNELRVAIAPVSNPTAKRFDYSAELYLGMPKAASSGTIPFSLAPGETRDISFPVTMPGAEGTYPVYLDVLSNSQLIGAYQATESVVISKPLPSIDVTEFHYVYKGLYTWSLTSSMIHGQDITHIGFSFRNNEAIVIDNVSVKMKVSWDSWTITWEPYRGPTRYLTKPAGEVILTSPLDQYLSPISQPFTAPPGTTQVWFSFTPVEGYPRAQALAEVWVSGELVASASLDFDVTYGS